MLKNTEGPWRVDPNHPGDVQTINGDDVFLTLHSGMNGKEYLIRGIKISFDEAKANAHLIAASPELLNITKILLKHLQENDFDVCGTPDWMIETAQTIIEKAEGVNHAKN